MREWVLTALDFLEGVDYGDARLVQIEEQKITVRNGVVEQIHTGLTVGIGIRVLDHGSWGVYATSDLSVPGIAEAVKQAKAIAQASRLGGGHPLTLAEVEPVQDTYVTPHQIDPFTVPLDQKIEVLLKTDQILREGKHIVTREGTLRFVKRYQVFGSTEGSLIEQTIIESGGGYHVFAFRDGILTRRSYPAAHGGNMQRKGYEFIEEMDFVGHAPKVVEEAEALLKAPPAPEGVMDLVIHHSQMVLQIHESVGHPLELDRVLGWEAGYAGESFATLEKLGTFQYGSPLMNITSDSTLPGGLGTYGYDDDGVPAQRVYLIQEGILKGYLSSRDTALFIGRKSVGAARAQDWSRMPIVRMTNVNLEPGDMTLEELIDGVKDGLFIMTNRSWSIDQRRLNFQFATEIGWRIRNGKLAEMVRTPIYSGITPEFWRSMDGVANDWYLWGIQNCGKGEPSQAMHTGHGTPSARFRNVRVGSVKD